MTTVSATSSSTSSTASTSSSTSSTSTDYTSFDTTALVEAKLSSRYSRIDSLNTQITGNQAKIKAYQTLQTDLQSLTTSLEKLRSDPSSSGQSSDVFRARTAYLTASNSSTASTYMAATVAAGTSMGTHSITISQVAKTNILSCTAQTSKTTDLGWSGTFTLGTSAGGSASVNITATMSLGDIADAINAQTSSSGVKASVMKVSDSSYQLILSTSQTGETITASDTSGTLLSDSLGLLDSTGAVQSSAVLQAAQDAKFSVDGVSITRSTNDVSDVLDGVTLHLYAAPSTDTTLNLEIDNDLTSVKDAITSFVDAYNTFRDLVVTNQSTNSDGTASTDATLFGDATLRNVASDAQSILSSAVDEHSLAAIGITFDDNNKLSVNSTTLENALLDDFDGVQSLFAYKMTASSGDLGLIRHPDKSMSFTLDVTVDSSGNLTGASVGGDSSLFTISGGAIKGVAGTAYEGLTLVYTGTTAKSITVDLSQGLADRLYQAADAVSNADTGSLADIIDNLTSTDNDLNDRVSSLEASTTAYKNALTTLYANIASKLSTASYTVNLLKALLNSNSSN